MHFTPEQTALAREHHAAWTRAALTTDQGDPFCCTPEWQMSFHEAFGPERKLLIRSDTDCVAAFAEHLVSPGKAVLAPIETHWLFGAPLLGHRSLELFGEMLPGIEQRYEIFPKIIISGMRPEATFPRLLIERFGHHFDVYLSSSTVQCASSLRGGLDGFLSRRSANHRKKLKKQARRAREVGVTFERVLPATPEAAAVAFGRIIAVEQKSWKGIGKCGMAEPPAREFYDAMLRMLSAFGGSRIIFARQGGEDIGFIFGAVAGTVYRGQQFSYSDDWKEYGIGNLMQVEKVRWLCEEGVARYDMGPLTGPKMGYKRHWTEIEIPLETWLLVRRQSIIPLRSFGE